MHRRNKKPPKKQVSFAIQCFNLSTSVQTRSPLPNGLRKLELGEFCKLIGCEMNIPVHIHIQNNVMKLADTAQDSIWRDFLPVASISLADWLEQTMYLSNRVKITLAYTIARSVWQYYNSYWMATPWTHDNIQIMKERLTDRNHIRPHPYFATKLYKFKGQILDYCLADDLFHMYPSILALGVILIEIATKQPFRHERLDYLWDETTINDYYEWAWTTANCSNLGNMIGAAYEAVVNNCLDAELFKDGSIDPSKFDEDLEIRQSRLYEKVVLPLQDLYHAYRDDWEIQEVSKPEIPISQNPPQTEQTRPVSRSRFTIAIFCALPLEADAVSEVFEKILDEEVEDYHKAPGDGNTYTLGKLLHHNVVLVHMAGMGKGAASQAASSIRSSYPEIKLALVVGICGGVPSYVAGEDDLVLGDVVISDGIVQYDFGRRFPDTFLSKARPEIAGPKLRGLLAKLKGVRGRERIEMKLSQHLGVLKNKLGPQGAGYPGMEKDELFEPTYRHKHHDPAACGLCSACKHGTDPVCEDARLLTCQQLGCQKGSLVPRKRLQGASANGCPPSPKIHFGLFGSGDTVMKSGQHRDKTATTHDLIAFEMEASGVWDILPCLVIKGVCDYADSHKNKNWQHYAAATAASCMKAVLEECAIGDWLVLAQFKWYRMGLSD
jgi:nucleoside phosphorylase